MHPSQINVYKYLKYKTKYSKLKHSQITQSTIKHIINKNTHQLLHDKLVDWWKPFTDGQILVLYRDNTSELVDKKNIDTNIDDLSVKIWLDTSITDSLNLFVNHLIVNNHDLVTHILNHQIDDYSSLFRSDDNFYRIFKYDDTSECGYRSYTIRLEPNVEYL